MSECINCDTCLRHCPPQFGAIFNHGIDVIIIPELCSGCLKCVDQPVDKGNFRADDGQVDGVVQGDGHQGLCVLNRNG